MGLFNALRTSVSGMNAQSSFLSTIGDNIANSGTTGYKEASLQFETVLGQQSSGSYESGGVLSQTRYNITEQGTLTQTTSDKDLAIQGNGFFVVSQPGTTGTFLTRAGSFGTDSDGNMVNTAGYTLMGYAINPDGTPSTNLSAVNVASSKLVAAASTSGTLTGNLPSADSTTSAPETNSITLYDQSGTAVNTTLSFQKTAANQWTVTATTASGTITSSPANLTFDSSGALTGGSPMVLTGTSSNGNPFSVSVDMTGMSQLASGFQAQANINGAAPSTLQSVSIGSDGIVTGVYPSGIKQSMFEIPLATVTSPDNLTALTGNVYAQSNTSGQVIINQAGSGAAGTIASGNLESSTVDIATELTNMIVAQRAYEANTKVLQAASDLLTKLDQIQTG